MIVKEIASTQNQKYKYFKSLKTKKARNENRQYVVEGIKSVKDAQAADADIDCLIISDDFECEITADVVYKVSHSIFVGLCDTETPQGVLAVINMPNNCEKSLSERDLYLYCDKVTDPGNMGTIIRICDAVDCGLLLSKGTVDIYNPKTVRSSMGSFFHTPITDGLSTEDLKKLKKDGYKIIGSALNNNTTDYSAADYSGKIVIVVGNEANGISKDILELADFCVKIPIFGRAESLNVGVASALLLYEARKKRDF